jgi:hypothetical protein
MENQRPPSGDAVRWLFNYVNTMHKLIYLNGFSHNDFRVNISTVDESQERMQTYELYVHSNGDVSVTKHAGR